MLKVPAGVGSLACKNAPESNVIIFGAQIWALRGVKIGFVRSTATGFFSPRGVAVAPQSAKSLAEHSSISTGTLSHAAQSPFGAERHGEILMS